MLVLPVDLYTCIYILKMYVHVFAGRPGPYLCDLYAIKYGDLCTSSKIVTVPMQCYMYMLGPDFSGLTMTQLM